MKFGKLVGVIAVVAVLLLLWQIRQVLLLVFAAVVFATAINRIVNLIRRLPVPVPRGIAVAIALTAIISLLSLTVWFVAPAIADQLPEYTFLSEQGFGQIQMWYQRVRGIVPGDPLAGTRLTELLPQLTQFSPTWLGRLLALFTGSLDFIINLLLVTVVTIMLLSNPESYRKMVILAFPKFYRVRADAILDECEEALSGWAIGILFNMAVITVFSGVGLAIIGVPLPMVNAIIAGLLTFIPNIGPLLSIIPPVLMALAIQPWKALAVVGLYFLIQQLEGSVLTPIVMEKQTSLLPAIALIAQVVAAVFFGVLGLFLALPMVIVTQVWIKELLVKDILDRWPTPRRQQTRPIAIRPKIHH